MPTKTMMLVQFIASLYLQHLLCNTHLPLLNSMATIILRSNEVPHALVLFCVLFSVLLMLPNCGAYEFLVGGQKGWSLPSDSSSNPYNQWAQKSRFQIGDSLGKFLFKLKSPTLCMSSSLLLTLIQGRGNKWDSLTKSKSNGIF